jgi:hypothetical protein
MILEVILHDPQKLLVRLLIAVIVIALCMALYPMIYCQVAKLC